jgi:hypothetical protein
MLYMNNQIDVVIDFVKNDVPNNPKILETVIYLKEEPDYESEESYFVFINGYFYGYPKR